MKHKIGFTLTEVLVVLVVIGGIAAVTIPSTVNGLRVAQFKTAYKKAYTEAVGTGLAMKMKHTLPKTNISEDTMRFYEALNSRLNANSYVSTSSTQVNSGVIPKPSDFKRGIKINDTIYGLASEATNEVTPYSITTFTPSPWIVTENNTAFSIMCGGVTGVQAPCESIYKIASKKTQQEAAIASCAILIVDVNGLSKGPNKFEPQAGPATGFRINLSTKTIDSEKPLDELTGDQYLLFVGKDGVTAGPRNTTVGGRIVADIK